MKLEPFDSGVPSNYIHDQIMSPLAISIADGMYDHFHWLCTELLKFAKDQAVIPYDQTLGGRWILYLLSAEEMDPNCEFSIYVESVIDRMFLLYDALCEINRLASIGGYITPVTIRNDTGNLRTSISSFGTGLAKDVIVALGGFTDIIDVCGGNGSLLDTLINVGGEKIKSYTNVDLDPNAAGVSFSSHVDSYKYQSGDEAVTTRAIVMDANDYLVEAKPAGDFVSIHSLYYLDEGSKHKIKGSSSGVAHFSDLLFDGNDAENDNSASVVLVDNKLNGIIGGYPVINEDMVFSDEVGIVYPVRFLNSARKNLLDFPVISRSLCFWSRRLAYRGRQIISRAGVEYSLVPSSYNVQFRRGKIHELDSADYYFLRRMGFYISSKIDGVCGFLSSSAGVYYLSFRDGSQFRVEDPTGKSVNMGHIENTINVEVVYNNVTKLYQFWYVCDSPKKFPSEPSARAQHIRDQFITLSYRIDVAKRSYCTLFFKPYLWVEPDNVKTTYFNLNPIFGTVPTDGIVLHDPFGNFTGFWKPWRTVDVYVDKIADGLKTSFNGLHYVVDDDRCLFIRPGIYEIVAIDGRLQILNRRIEKQNGGDIPVHSRNDLFPFEGDKVMVAGVKVQFESLEIHDYVRRYGQNYATIMSNVSAIIFSAADVKVIFNQVMGYLKYSCQKHGDYYYVTDFILAITSTTSYDPTRVWLSFLQAKLLTGNGPYSPEIVFDGSYRAIVRVD